MFRRKRHQQLIVSLLVLVLGLSAVNAAAAQEKQSKKQQEPVPEGKPVLWQEPADLESRNLLIGPGGEEQKPDLSRVTFVKEEGLTGYSVKYRVRDGAGKTWIAKLGNEAQPETASLRLVWAAGYMTEINYLVPCVRIAGAPEPRKKVARCEGKGFADVRFEARPEGIRRLGEWSWENNPFAGTREFRGLVVLMGLLNNWDLKDANNKVLLVRDEATGEFAHHHIISDLGATFGKTGNFITHSRNEPEKYIKTKFVEGLKEGRVVFNYNGKNQKLFGDISVEDAKWIGDLLARLSDQQIADAFRAANYNAQDTQLLAAEVRDRINQLVNLAPAAAPANAATAPGSN